MRSPLTTTHRDQLRKAITAARRQGEAGARRAIEALAVATAKPHDSMSPEDRELRNRLRAHGRQLGDVRDTGTGDQSIGRLVHEVAYEHWHRMLFARFLAENGLLIESEAGVAITLDECDELAREQGEDPHEMAARFAQSALPQIFRVGDPVLELKLAPETRQTLEQLLDDLPREVFTADDSLGWTYQFWQTEKKDEVNASGVKIGADELPPVTQLFTEHYMVQFLFHNTIGAWHAGKVLAAHPELAKTVGSEEELRRAVSLHAQGGYDFDYLRFVKDVDVDVDAASRRVNSRSDAVVDAASRRVSAADQLTTNHKSRDGSSTVDAASRRVDPNQTPASAEATLTFFHKEEPIGNLSGNLPHWRQEAVTYFVTFRTADSLPQERLKLWLKEREEWLAEHPEPHDEATRREYHERFPGRIQQWLDANHGECVLDLPEVRSIVEGALRHFDGARYHLDEFVVMPNHVHAIVTPVGEHSLSGILHSWKSFTAHEILKVDAASRRVERAAARHGWKTPKVWQKESFDHIVRSPEQLDRIRQYIRENPRVDAASRRVFAPDQQTAEHKSRDGSSTFTIAHKSRDGSSTFTIAHKSRDGSSTVDAASRRVDSRHGADSAVETRRDAASTFWRPAAGVFEGWPKTAKELKVLDPCCGSGHFLVEGFELIVRLRMDEEGLAREDAIRAVLADNLHGLEIDPRCTQIAAFNLALAAWKLAGKPIELPPLNVACSGLAPNASKEEWLTLADDAAAAGGMPASRDLYGVDESLLSARLKGDLAELYELFEQAPVLGSLVDPAGSKGPLYQGDFASLRPLLAAALAGERGAGEAVERTVAAQGMARAAELLAGTYTLVITNVPYLQSGNQSQDLRDYANLHHAHAKSNLATVFLDRMLRWNGPGGSVASVAPQNWFAQKTFEQFRKSLLKNMSWNAVARLGPGAFETISGEVVNVVLVGLTSSEGSGVGFSVDASAVATPAGKAGACINTTLTNFNQPAQLRNPSSTIVLGAVAEYAPLARFATSRQGISPADTARFGRKYWELPAVGQEHCLWRGTSKSDADDGGCTNALWNCDALSRAVDGGRAFFRGRQAWARDGVAVNPTGTLVCTLYRGEFFDDNLQVLIPASPELLPAIWVFCSSDHYKKAVRHIDQGLKVRSALVKVPFDRRHWERVAAEKYPNGLPEPQSDDPTQWLFHGHPAKAAPATTLQVAVARLLGYRWPPEREAGTKRRDAASTVDVDVDVNVDAASRRVSAADQLTTNHKSRDGSSTAHTSRDGSSTDTSRDGCSTLRLAEEARAWVERCSELERFADRDGVVCLTPLRGERSAADRVRELLAAAFGAAWSGAKERELLAAAAGVGKAAESLDDWLRDRFFEEHCKLFHHRPFVWHLWDGRADGFNCLVNAHRLTGPDGEGRRTLEALTYSYLGDWIERQRAEQREGREGADGRLAAALDLQGQLEKILGGEPPYDLFVRWKPLHEQAIGWAPDINDGIRLNIRPFMSAELRTGGRKGAGILRWKPNITWTKDRGNEPESLRPKHDFPWFWSCPGNGTPEDRTDFPGGDTFDGNRWNDLHYTNATKRAARERALKGAKP